MIRIEDIKFPYYHKQEVGGVMSFFHTVLLQADQSGELMHNINDIELRNQIKTWSRYTTFVCQN